MKTKLTEIPLVSTISFVVLVVVIVFSFSAGILFEKQRNQKLVKSQSGQNPQSSQISPTPQTPPIPQKLIVIDVTDGDTLKLNTGKIFRLYGVNAPERNEKFYKESVEFTKNLVLNKEITYEQEDKYKEDKFGRILGYVFVEGKQLNLELVKAGLAKVVIYQKRAKLKYQDELVAAENVAKGKGIGVWSQ